MLLKLVSFYLAFGATVLGCLSVEESTQNEDADLVVQPRDSDQQLGIRMYDGVNLNGSSVFRSNASLDKPITIKDSFEFVGDIWAVGTSSKDNSSRVIIWASAIDSSALPFPAGTDQIIDIQVGGCPEPCSGAGTCSLDSGSPVCKCPDGFNGTQCEICDEGFFGPNCQPCPENCKTCDQGISGSGLCLVPAPPNPDCQCRNGECDSDGKCICLPGWGSSNNGTECAQCRQGFYLKKEADGNGRAGCQTCETGCSVCDPETGNCQYCLNGFSLDMTDLKKCNALVSGSEIGGCPPKSYYVGKNATPPCANCSAVCQTCTGASSNECQDCAPGRLRLNTSCIIPNSKGVCDESDGMIGDNNKQKCESCGAVDPNCWRCEIEGYNASSTIESDARCTSCLSGFFVLDGKCAENCPMGTFIPENSTTCTACTQPCTSCVGAPNFCTSCAAGMVAYLGQCIKKKCPQGAFASNGTCLPCHPDCKTCSGPAFNQCTSCFRELPYLKDKRCLTASACQSNQYFNFTTWTCHNCHSSCSSCVGNGNAMCMSCTNSSSIVVNGRCFVVPQLGPALWR